MAASVPACAPHQGRMRMDAAAAFRCFHGLEPPYEFASFGVIKDGGSLRGEIQGASSLRLVFCWDGRMRGPSEPEYDATRNVYFRAEYFLDQGADRVEVGSECETVFIDALKSFAAKNLKQPNGPKFRAAAMASKLAARLEQQRRSTDSTRARARTMGSAVHFHTK